MSDCRASKCCAVRHPNHRPLSVDQVAVCVLNPDPVYRKLAAYMPICHPIAEWDRIYKLRTTSVNSASVGELNAYVGHQRQYLKPLI